MTNAYITGGLTVIPSIAVGADVPQTMVSTLAETTYTTSSASPSVGGYTRIASTDAGSRSVTLYAGYSALNPTERGQTRIHEGIHDAFSLTDQQIAQAATGNNFADGEEGKAQASAEFQKELDKHCR